MPRARKTYSERKAAFRERWGIDFNEARREARRLGVPATSPARAARSLATTVRGLSRRPATTLLDKATDAASAVWGLRNGRYLDVAHAEREQGLPPGSVKAWMPEAFDSTGRLRRSDRAPVPMTLVDGTIILTRGSHARRRLAAHHRDVNHYLRTGDETVLAKWEGKTIGGHVLEWRPEVLRALAGRGEISPNPYPERIGRAMGAAA